MIQYIYNNVINISTFIGGRIYKESVVKLTLSTLPHTLVLALNSTQTVLIIMKYIKN